jgi:hypothetical protein
MKNLLFILFSFYSLNTMAQKEDYFYQIPSAPDSYSASNILARMIDGVGFRYYWATIGLEQKDLDYSPDGDKRRSTQETLNHIYGLVDISRNAVLGVSSNSSTRVTPTDFNELRTKTLFLLEEASMYLRTHELDPENQKIVFESAKGNSEIPLWNVINGPVSDALWHIGQVVSFRRSSGNPFPDGVNVLLGGKRD